MVNMDVRYIVYVFDSDSSRPSWCEKYIGQHLIEWLNVDTEVKKGKIGNNYSFKYKSSAFWFWLVWYD